MMPANNPMESFLNSVQVVKDALSPLEFGMRKAAKDLEGCWGVSKNYNGGSHVELNSNSYCSSNTKFQICSNKKKERTEERKKGLSIKVPIKSMLGMFSFKQEKGCEKNGRNDRAKKGLKQKESEDGSCTNCLQFAVAWSFLVNGFVQAFPITLKNSKKRFQKLADTDTGNPHLCKDGLKSRVFSQSKSQSANSVKNEFGNDKEAKIASLECFIGYVFDQLVVNLQKFDQSLQKNEDYDCSASTSPQFDYMKAVMSIWEGHKVDVNGFLGNLKFARVGGVPSGIVGVSSPVNEEGDDGISGGNAEETGGIPPRSWLVDCSVFPYQM